MGIKSTLSQWRRYDLTVTKEELEVAIKKWRSKRAERRVVTKQEEALKKEETELKRFIIAAFEDEKYEGMVIDDRITALSFRDVGVVEDREAFVEYIYEHQALDLLQFRPNSAAILDRMDAGEEVPGTDVIQLSDLSDRKA